MMRNISGGANGSIFKILRRKSISSTFGEGRRGVGGKKSTDERDERCGGTSYRHYGNAPWEIRTISKGYSRNGGPGMSYFVYPIGPEYPRLPTRDCNSPPPLPLLPLEKVSTYG